MKTAETKSNLAMSLSGQPARTEQLLWESLATYAVSQGKPSIEQVGVISNLGASLFGRDDFYHAGKLFDKAIAMHDSLPKADQDAVSYATFHHNLGVCLERMDADAPDAQAHFKVGLGLREQNLPRNHPDIAESLRHTAHFEEPMVAETMYRRAVQIMEFNYGVGDVNVGMDYLNLAQALRSLRSPEAPAYFQRVKQICAKLLPDDPLVREYRRVLAQTTK